MYENLLLGIDVGTTFTKVGIFSEKGELIHLESSPTPINWEGPESATHDPVKLWNVVLELLKKVISRVKDEKKGEIVSIGISSFGESGVLVDSKGEPLGPVFTWFDIRTKEIYEKWKNFIEPKNLRYYTGLFPDYTYTLYKLLWFKEYAPEIFDKKPRWVSIADWIAYKLTGNLQVGVTHASRTLVFDLKKKKWMKDFLYEVGLPPDIFAPIRFPGEEIGKITKEVSKITNLSLDTYVMETCHDQPSAGAGIGVIKPGIIMNSCGTAEVFFGVITPENLDELLKTSSVVIGHHVLPDQYYIMSTMRISGSVLNWFLEALSEFSGKNYKEVLDKLIKSAEEIPYDSQIFFFPHLRQMYDFPDENSVNSGIFIGIKENHKIPHLFRAIIEGLSLESYRILKRILNVLGERKDLIIRAVGGPTKIPLWMQIKADILSLPIEVYEISESACFGASWLSWYHLNAKRGIKIDHPLPQRVSIYKPRGDKKVEELKENYEKLLSKLSKIQELSL